MANKTFESLFKVYPCLNSELSMVANQLYKFGKQIAQEPSAALSSGMDEHAIRRQQEYIAYSKAIIESLRAKPRPDWTKTHPTNFAVDLRVQYRMFVEGPEGQQISLNDQTQMLARLWMIAAVELLESQSSSQAGSLYEKDYERALNNIGTVSKFIEEISSRPQMLDLSELSVPGATLQNPITAVE